jgi:tRNA pseudouridine55 synthase
MTNAPWHGLLVLDKPAGITSRTAVDRAQRWLPRGTRIGHTGTLDPLATGVLVLCIGAATRLTEYVQNMRKTYRATVLLGARSGTDDSEGLVVHQAVPRPPHLAAVRGQLEKFLGDIDQVPPAYSAAKVAGRRAYDLARRGEEAALQPRTVRINGIDVLAYAWPRLELEVRCGKGTYIRSLARDLGERLGCGGLIESLRRTRVGPFTAEDAVGLDVEPAVARAQLKPLAAAMVDLPRVEVTAEDAERLRHGQQVRAVRIPPGITVPGEGCEAAVFAPGGFLVGVASVHGSARFLKPVKILPIEDGADGSRKADGEAPH